MNRTLSRHLVVACIAHKLRRYVELTQPPFKHCNINQIKALITSLELSMTDLLEQHRVDEYRIIRTTLWALCCEFEQAYEDRFSSLSVSLAADVECRTMHQLFHAEMEELFLAGQINWGRIVALFVFVNHMCVVAVQQGHVQLVLELVEWTCNWIEQRLMMWISANGGWEGLITFYNNENVSQRSWSTIATIAVGTLLLGTLGVFIFKK